MRNALNYLIIVTVFLVTEISGKCEGKFDEGGESMHVTGEQSHWDQAFKPEDSTTEGPDINTPDFNVGHRTSTGMIDIDTNKNPADSTGGESMHVTGEQSNWDQAFKPEDNITDGPDINTPDFNIGHRFSTGMVDIDANKHPDDSTGGKETFEFCSGENNKTLIEGVCCPKGSFLDTESNCQCEANMSLNFKSGICECQANKHFNNKILKCEEESDIIIGKKCRCPMNSEYNESSDKCDCQGDLIHDASKDLCVCENGKFQHGLLCCPEFSDVRNGHCSCRGDLVMNSISNQCECKQDASDGTQLVQFGTTCCKKDQISIDGKCKCFNDLQVEGGQCKCSLSNPAACCDSPKIFDSHLKACKCPVGMFGGKNSSICCPVGTIEDEGSETCTCDKSSGAVYDQASQKCVCPGDLLQLVNGICTCPGDLIGGSVYGECVCPEGKYLADDSTYICCPRDQMFYRDTQTCSCKPGMQLSPGPDGSCRCPEDRVYNPLTRKCSCQSPKVEVNDQCVCQNGSVVDGTVVCCESFEFFDELKKECRICPDKYILKGGKCTKCPLGFMRNADDLDECVASKYSTVAGLLMYVLAVLVFVILGIFFSM
ncbi:MAG: hypothetical protein MHMPM18_001154 [Marteilia pararefringens]